MMAQAGAKTSTDDCHEIASAIRSALKNMTTIPSRIEYFSQKCPDRECFVFHSSKERFAFTWKVLHDLASRFAWLLRENGFEKNDVIANTLPNSPERLITDLGAVYAGCIPMNGQILLADGEDFMLSARVSRCKAVVLYPKDDQPAWKILGKQVTENSSKLFTRLCTNDAPDMTKAILVSRVSENGPGCNLMKELKTDKVGTYVAKLDAHDVVMVFTTSGTTGYSKLVPRSHHWVTASTTGATEQKELDNVVIDDCFNDRPLGWLGGYPVTTFSMGQKRVLTDALEEGLDVHGRAALTWETMKKENCGMSAILPLDLYAVHDYVKSKSEPDGKMKLLLSGGQPLTKLQLTHMLELFESVFIGYGSTEAGIVSGALIKDPQFEDFYAGKLMIKKDEFKILNKDQMECATGELGRIWVRGHAVFEGYFNKLDDVDEKTEKAFGPDGWFDVGDNGYMNDKGDLYVIGRENDVIMYGSFCVYPGWLEKKLVTHPDIVTAVVVPVSDPVLFHNICACVQFTKNKTVSESDLQTFCESMFATSSESEITPIPKYFMVLDEIPIAATGKTDRKLLKKKAEERYGQVKK